MSEYSEIIWDLVLPYPESQRTYTIEEKMKYLQAYIDKCNKELKS